MSFARPWWLAGVPAALLVIPLLAWLVERARRRRLGRFAEPRTLARLVPPPLGVSRSLRVALLALAVAALAVGLARPQWGSEPERVRRRGLDVMFVLDTSLSMEAPALAGARESRLEAAHRAIIDLAEMMRGDRTGVVAFAGDAQVLCPLTVDDGALRLFLEVASPDLLPVAGSDLGRGVALASSSFRANERKFKVIVVLSDGEDNEGRGISAARDAADRGVVIHAIGFGAPEGEPIPLRDQQGRPLGFKKDADGHVVSTRLDERTLRAMADAGKGIYVSWRAGDRGLRSVADAVAEMEKRELDSTLAATREDHAEIPLAVAFGALALEALVSLVVRRGRAPVLAAAAPAAGEEGRPAEATAKRRLHLRRRARARAAAAVRAGALVLGLGLAGAGRVAASDTAEGEKAFAEQRYDAAAEAFRKALEKDPQSPALQYDLGTALLRAGKLEEAIAALSRAAAGGDAGIRARAEYNIGNAYHAIEKRKEALESYKNALRLAPGDVEAKHNYELTKRELEATPPPTPTPSPSPSPQPKPEESPSPSPSPSPQGGEPSPSPGTSPPPEGSPSPTPGEEGGEPTPAAGEPTPRPEGELDRKEAERLLDALAAQERTEPANKKRDRERALARDW